VIEKIRAKVEILKGRRYGGNAAGRITGRREKTGHTIFENH
jgi:hypothetical protein